MFTRFYKNSFSTLLGLAALAAPFAGSAIAQVNSVPIDDTVVLVPETEGDCREVNEAVGIYLGSDLDFPLGDPRPDEEIAGFSAGTEVSLTGLQDLTAGTAQVYGTSNAELLRVGFVDAGRLGPCS